MIVGSGQFKYRANAEQAGHPNLVARDMGGTSFDVSLIATGGPALSAEKDIAYRVPLDFIP